LIDLKTRQKRKIFNQKCKRKRGKLKVITLKALAKTLAISETLTTLVSIFFFVLRKRTLLVVPFLLRVDRGRLSGAGLILGPYMTKEIEGAL
jgi:hypothetical protein